MIEIPRKLLPFGCHGIEFEGESGTTHLSADCPFCGKAKHFFAARETGQWKCQSCGEQGNIVTFLGRVAAETHAETATIYWSQLAKNRGIPAAAFKRWKLGFNGREWLIPYFSETGTVRDIRRWIPGTRQVMSTTGCHVGLFGAAELAKAPAGVKVWVCEGEWDAIALRWALDEADRKDEIVVGVPGASIFKAEWTEWFRGKHVHLMYDNDDAGDAGSKRAAAILRGVTFSLEFLCWSDALPKGYDVRDFVKAGLIGKWPAKKIVKQLCLRLKPKHRHDTAADDAPDGPTAPAGPPITFPELLEVFRRWLLMDADMENALRVCLAVCLSEQLPGDPLWFYLVGPPGSGKTAVLNTFRKSDSCLFRSTLTPASLVSGFQRTPDPSLFPLMQAKTAIFKDATELFSIHPAAREEIWSIFRGAFDGYVYKQFGNGVVREYDPLHFSLLMGVTPIIHGDSTATLGERFLKFEMVKGVGFNAEEQIWAAINNISREGRMEEELTMAVNRFLLRRVNVDHVPEVPIWAKRRVVALAQLVGMLRARVDREQWGEREIKYRPAHEVGTRLAKQLVKFASMVAAVADEASLSPENFALVERVAFDSAIGFHLDMVMALMKFGSGATQEEIAESSRLPRTNIQRKLEDLFLLGIVRKEKGRGPGPIIQGTARRGAPPTKYFMCDRIAELWRAAVASNEGVESAAARADANRRRRPWSVGPKVKRLVAVN